MTTYKDIENDKNYIKVLDKGFCGLIDKMGVDEDIARAARLSYGKETKKIQTDRGLIRYLIRNDHTSPIEMCELKFHIKLPIFVMRQLVRHRTASLNEYSARYSVMTDEYYSPDLSVLKPQSTTNKQGRDGELSDLEKTTYKNIIDRVSESSYKEYEELLNPKNYNIDNPQGLSRELARMVLPVNFYTEVYWKIDLLNLFKTLRLRDDHHAQYEVQEYARAIAKFTKEHFPVAYEAYEDYWKNGCKFSASEMNIIRSLIHVESEIEKNNKLEEIINLMGGEKQFYEANNMSKGEFAEFKKKLKI